MGLVFVFEIGYTVSSIEKLIFQIPCPVHNLKDNITMANRTTKPLQHTQHNHGNPLPNFTKRMLSWGRVENTSLWFLKQPVRQRGKALAMYKLAVLATILISVLWGGGAAEGIEGNLEFPLYSWQHMFGIYFTFSHGCPLCQSLTHFYQSYWYNMALHNCYLVEDYTAKFILELWFQQDDTVTVVGAG